MQAWKLGVIMSHKVLVIEDEPTLARLFSYNLTQEGYDTTVIDHGGGGFTSALQRCLILLFWILCCQE